MLKWVVVSTLIVQNGAFDLEQACAREIGKLNKSEKLSCVHVYNTLHGSYRLGDLPRWCPIFGNNRKNLASYFVHHPSSVRIRMPLYTRLSETLAPNSLVKL